MPLWLDRSELDDRYGESEVEGMESAVTSGNGAASRPSTGQDIACFAGSADLLDFAMVGERIGSSAEIGQSESIPGTSSVLVTSWRLHRGSGLVY